MLFKTPGVASYIRDNPKTNMAVTPASTEKMEAKPHIPMKAFFPLHGNILQMKFHYFCKKMPVF